MSNLPTNLPSETTPQPIKRNYIIEFSETFTKLAAALVLSRKFFGRIFATETADIKSDKATYQYKYADLNAVIAATTQALADQGLVVLQGATTGDNATLVTVETMLLHESGEWARTRISLKTTSNTPQGVGSAITYARRYALQALLGVASQDDDGRNWNDDARGNGNRNQQQQRPAAAVGNTATPPKNGNKATVEGPMPDAMKATVRRLFADLNLAEAPHVQQLTNNVKESVDELTFGEGNTLLQALQRAKAEKSKQA